MEKNKKTCLEKYGGHYSKLSEYKQKAKNKKLELYGDENYNNMEKTKKTKFKLYGNENYNNIEKNKKTCNEKYNTDSVFNVNEIREKIYESRKNKLINLYKKYNLIDVDYDKYVYICKCGKNHIFEIPKTIFYNRLKTNTTLCTICNPIGFVYSDKENLIYNFIKDNCEYDIIKNSRNIIKPYELDIYIPELKLAFEFNGIWWHNELYKPNNYHLEKTELCEQQGIQLIHVYEDDWIHKQDIVKSIILNKITKSKNILYAKNCELKEIYDTNQVRLFLNKNDINGFIKSNIKIGLFYNDELVSLMIFNNNKKCELLRFCDKINTTVVDSDKYLFKYFIEKYNQNYITANLNRNYNNGKKYQNIGFKVVGKTAPNYSYIINGTRYNKANYKKSSLVKSGFDITKTEHEIMLDRKIYRIYDSGDIKLLFKK
jgi:hypothetical protein